MGYRFIACSRQGDVSVVKLADPGSLNAASTGMVDELLEAIALAGSDARCLLLTGEGRGFCSGANLADGVDPQAPDYDAGLPLETHYNLLMRAMRDLPIPIVTAVNGVTAGIGCAIAMTGDIVLAAENAYFLQAFRHIGLISDGGVAWLLAHAVGRARAMELLLLGERLPARTALEWGMVNRVHPSERLMEEAMTMAENLAAGPTVALAGIRRQMWRATESRFEDMLLAERDEQRGAGRTADHREGVAAFLAKRPPHFIGR